MVIQVGWLPQGCQPFVLSEANSDSGLNGRDVQTKALIGLIPIAFSFVHRETPWGEAQGKQLAKGLCFLSSEQP